MHLVLSGRVPVTTRGHTPKLGPGMALRFKALHDYHFEVVEQAKLLLIQHSLV